MKFLIPSNLFTAIFALNLPQAYKETIETKPASIIVNDIENGSAELGLIPSLDLINHKDLFVSKNVAISFDGDISNSYLYFKPNQNNFSTIKLQGDVTSNEVILSKILFKERFGSEVEIVLDTDDIEIKKNNYLLCGNINFEKKYFNKGVSFSDQVAEMINYPYSQYLLVSKNEDILKQINSELKDFDKVIEDNIEDNLSKIRFDKDIQSFIIEEFNSVYYEMTQNEVDGLLDLLKQPYFYGMIEEIPELKLI